MARFLVVLDVDSTLIENEVVELIAEEAGSHELVAAITARAMNGELDFEQSLRERVATLRGVQTASLDAVRRRVAVTAGVPELVRGIQSAGGIVGVVSGGFHEIVDPLAAELGLDLWRANRLESRDGILTGTLVGQVVDAEVKASTLREWADQHGIPLRQTVAVGDGANDMEMMGVAALSVGFDAKAPVREAADVILNVRDLSQVLPLLGLRG